MEFKADSFVCFDEAISWFYFKCIELVVVILVHYFLNNKVRTIN